MQCQKLDQENSDIITEYEDDQLYIEIECYHCHATQWAFVDYADFAKDDEHFTR